MSQGHRTEYKRSRRRFMLRTYVVLVLLIGLGIWIHGSPVEGWLALALVAGAVLVEFFLWVNVGLPRAVERGSNEFKQAYYGPEDG